MSDEGRRCLKRRPEASGRHRAAARGDAFGGGSQSSERGEP
jgi:hypothetical protein